MQATITPIEIQEKEKPAIPSSKSTLTSSQQKSTPQRNPIPPGQLGDLISTLPPYGTIHRESGSNFWAIVLDDSWQKAQTQIVQLCELQYDNSDWAQRGKDRAQEWHELVENQTKKEQKEEDDDAQRQPSEISWCAPPSVAGLHISLGRFDDEHDILADESRRRPRPPGIEEGARIHLEIGPIVEFAAMRKAPFNLPGQFTDENGMRFYPTHWVFADVEFSNLDFQPMYPPHISLACIATKLSVNEVGEFQKAVKRSEEQKRQPSDVKRDAQATENVTPESGGGSGGTNGDSKLSVMSIGIPLQSAAPSASSSSVCSNNSLSSNFSVTSFRSKAASIDSQSAYSPVTTPDIDDGMSPGATPVASESLRG